MSTHDVIRAWKDESYRQSLSEAEQNLLPDHPAGLIELNDADLDAVTGSIGSEIPQTYATVCTYGWRCYSASWTCRCTSP